MKDKLERNIEFNKARYQDFVGLRDKVKSKMPLYGLMLLFSVVLWIVFKDLVFLLVCLAVYVIIGLLLLFFWLKLSTIKKEMDADKKELNSLK